MKINEYLTSNITDEDIMWAESIIGGGVRFDEDRRSVINNMDSIDVQAFPGSGKTTLLVAKLALLVKKWKKTNAGICVLSHTNVAREEIENKLGKSEIGKRLLSYPHFIGTVHSFFDTFVALPWLRSNGYEINLIESDMVLEFRWNMLDNRIKYSLQKNYKDKNICQFVERIGNINWDKNGKIKDSIMDIINKSHKVGIFTFNEMMLYAQYALSNCSTISEIIQNRFPILFVDEAQDTDEFQWMMINQAFGDGIRQGFGDSNQAIYSNYTVDGQTGFPREGALVLRESKRFGGQIANFANCVAVSPGGMVGTNNIFSERNLQHTIFLFNKDNITDVIDAFGELLLSSFSDDELKTNSKEGCHAIGMIHIKKEETDINHLPKGIYDYWNGYEGQTTKNNEDYAYLIEYFRKGISEFEKSKEKSKQIQILAKGLRREINKSKKINYIPNSANVFLSIINSNPLHSDEIRIQIFDLAKYTGYIDEETWETIVGKIHILLGFFMIEDFSILRKFEKWTENSACKIVEDRGNYLPVNTYLYTNDDGTRSVGIEFGSIHSVKGRTHLATLILETYYKTHNMKSIIKYLCGSSGSKSNANIKRLKCQYVAMTRARALLCLAIPEAFIDEESQCKLQDAGWNIKKL